ncbi:hypothetical protein CRP01_02880 [Flavilitoribacter nigricans DSM 23189 = NBRC 102662]|uniref:Uncharacterized protein n=1 Tax=Flavilitoribacter nigricans (strain ATCC 23147 / DSM 23189 / NBRC 102662 / NCIMB 1420 / SS-2) TaxID=1122177 RepID=A0A2D0NIF7_FLAN2|nr:hypothetical protein CRP01_02880 [Flavilitoribacter nigricans DSM 23189 = NBRC 102662]
MDKSEVREFKKWLQSPIHNQREDVVQLFDYLMAGNHLYEDKFLEKERVYRKIFGKEPYNDAKLRQTVHFLFKSLEEYLYFKQYIQNDLHTRISLVESYRARGLEKMVKKNLDQVHRQLDEAEFRNEIYYRTNYEHQKEKYNHLSSQPKNAKINLQEVSDALDKTFIIEKLQWSCRGYFHQNLFRTQYDLGLLDAVLDKVEKNHMTEDPAIAIYYYVLKAITDEKDDQAYFEKLRSEINEYSRLFPHSQLREIYLMAINYCVRKMNAGVEGFAKETFEWYRLGISDEVLIDRGTLSPITFNNTVATAIKAGEFEWAEHFIDEWNAMLPESERENLSHFSRAKLFFEKKDYRRAMILLVQAEYNNILFNINAKSMLLKMYYEEGEMDALESLLDSFRIYIRRKEVLGYHRNRYLGLIKFTKKLLRVSPFEKEKVQKLREEIQNSNHPERQWLLERLDDM